MDIVERHILVTPHEHGVYQLTLNRPKVYNALSDELVRELGDHIHHLESQDARVFVLTGGNKVFAAGGDIAEMQHKTTEEVTREQYVSKVWSALENRTLPMIAAVNGLALGGGCELAMLCDIVIAGKSASFSLPETSLGIIPGAGGTQRLIRAVGKSRAMDMILSGSNMGALEAQRSGLIARVVDDHNVLAEALHVATRIAKRSKPVIAAARRAILAAEHGLARGMLSEQREFYATFDLADQKEGMSAFLEKRPAKWQDC
ncbi:MAG: enoyl-CoA hydratase-related protein [Cardiobacteriaceae bacterium]|nr:enoyl-CoA hydratase-related protein [Cardiobacteriaceae bacterium]